MRILGLDVGKKRIGVAISDSLNITAQPLEAIVRKSDGGTLEAIKGIISEFDVGEIVVGLPLNMNGTKGESAELALKFAEELKKRFDKPVKMWDERLTTAEAERFLIKSDVSRKKRKGVKDTMAAQLILEGYLNSREGTSGV